MLQLTTDVVSIFIFNISAGRLINNNSMSKMFAGSHTKLWGLQCFNRWYIILLCADCFNTRWFSCHHLQITAGTGKVYNTNFKLYLYLGWLSIQYMLFYSNALLADTNIYIYIYKSENRMVNRTMAQLKQLQAGTLLRIV